MRDDPSSKEAIVRYLLGDLPEEKLIEIEDRAFEDRQFLDEILAVESDLIDEYVRGEMSDASRRLFDSRFLASAERRQKVAFAKALATVLPETVVVGKERGAAAARAQTGVWQSFAAILRALNPTARFSLATAALLIVALGSWAVIETLRLRAEVAHLQAEREREQQEMESRLADERARSEDISSRLQSERERRARSEELVRELERERETQSTVLSLTLLPSIARSGGARPKLMLTQSARLVRLRIGIEPGDEYSGFSVTIRSQEGREIWAADNLRARRTGSQRTVVLNLPANILRPGEYELTLKGVTDDQTSEDIGYYYFNVLKK